ncbi:MAG: hypothetical protein R3Y11_01465 [Pseudomonadota bacterium]
MKKKTMSQKKERLLNLEAILNSANPAIKNFFHETYMEEMDKAHERTVLKLGLQFKNRLSPQQQNLLMEEASAQGLC